MANLSTELSNRCSLYAMEDVENALGEITHKPKLLRKIWCKITPKTGRVVESRAELSEAEITHEVMMRKKTADGICREMYFEYCGGRLDIRYILPHYRERDRVVAYCVQEGIR